MNYGTGEKVQIGDDVLIENRRTTGEVQHIIETDDDMKNFNVNEKGVLLKSGPFGLVFWPIEYKDDPVVFVSRKNT
jgi:hypothetical protein